MLLAMMQTGVELSTLADDPTPPQFTARIHQLKIVNESASSLHTHRQILLPPCRIVRANSLIYKQKIVHEY